MRLHVCSLQSNNSISSIHLTPDNKISRVRVSVTNNNEFWIGWLHLLMPSFTVTLNYNQLQQLTINDCLRLAPFLTGLQLSAVLVFLLLWLAWFWFTNYEWRLTYEWMRSYLYSFRCLLANTPQLNTQLNSITELWTLLRMSQLNAVHILIHYFHTFFPSTPMSPMWHRPFRLINRICISHFLCVWCQYP
jgi:hypothetical protein